MFITIDKNKNRVCEENICRKNGKDKKVNII